MIIPKSASIPDAKVRDYLLKPQAKSDKSKFLGLAGYTKQDYQVLISSIFAGNSFQARRCCRNELWTENFIDYAVRSPARTVRNYT